MGKVDPLDWMNRPKKTVKPHLLSSDELLFREHEKELASRVGGKQTVGSGNKLDKGDVKTDSYRFEAKSTKRRSLSIKLDWLEKIVKESLDTGRLPVVSFLFDAANTPCSKRWILIEEDHFLELTGINE